MLHADTPRIQPHDLDAEQGVLGAILLDPPAMAVAQDLLKPEYFYLSSYQKIFRAISEVERIDLVTVGDRLKEKGELSEVGGHGGLAEILASVASSSNIAYHCGIVLDNFLRRESIKIFSAGLRRAYDSASVGDLISDAQHALGELASGRDRRTWCPMATVAREALDHVDEASKGGAMVLGLSTGYKAIDSIIGGLQPSDLNIWAGRPSMGKTSIVLGAALNAAKNGAHVGIISLEMSRIQLGLRLLAMGAPLDVHALRTGRIAQEGWWLIANTASQLESLPIWIDDSSSLTIEQVMAKARLLHTKHRLDLLVLDYLQLLQVRSAETRQQGIADAARNLKLLAKELNIPVLVLSQLSRDCEKREDKRPMLADLRDSGAIEQDADVVLFLYRHEVYDWDTEEKGVAEVLIRKHRNGPIGDIRLKFIDRFARFEDLTD